MSDIDLPVIDKDLGVIVTRVNVDSYSAGTGWYVHKIPEKENKMYGRWREADDLKKWCNEELVKLPESHVPDDVDREWVLDVLEAVLLESGDSLCKRCSKHVPVGDLEADGGYVAVYCPECAGSCSECGSSDWKPHPGNESNNARTHNHKLCKSCGNKAISSVSTA